MARWLIGTHDHFKANSAILVEDNLILYNPFVLFEFRSNALLLLVAAKMTLAQGRILSSIPRKHYILFFPHCCSYLKL